MPPVVAPRGLFPPAVAISLVRLAGERPETLGRSLSPSLVHKICSQGHGGRTCPGRLLCILNCDELYLEPI